MIILDVNLHNRFKQDFLGARRGAQNFNSEKFFRTSFVHVPSSRRRRNFYLLDLRDFFSNICHLSSEILRYLSSPPRHVSEFPEPRNYNIPSCSPRPFITPTVLALYTVNSSIYSHCVFQVGPAVCNNEWMNNKCIDFSLNIILQFNWDAINNMRIQTSIRSPFVLMNSLHE